MDAPLYGLLQNVLVNVAWYCSFSCSDGKCSYRGESVLIYILKDEILI